MILFPILEKNSIYFSHCGIFIFYHTWYDFPNLHIYHLSYGIVILTLLAIISFCSND